MSHVAYTTTSRHGSVSSKGIVAFVRKLPEWIAKRSQLRAAERYLNAMDDRQLTDIGLTRGEIRDVVWGERSAR